jgi:thioesterase domain-containing protein/acyl carrier protein
MIPAGTGLRRVIEDGEQSIGEDSFVVPRWFYQQNSWIENPQSSNSALYNYPLLLRIRGPLNPKALESSLQELVKRHGVLRSLFRLSGKELLQIVQPSQSFSLPMTDLSDLAESERESRARLIALEDTERPFDLSRQLPFRASLLCFDPEDYALVLITHHLVYDDWSNGILIRELSALYNAFVAGQPSPLPDLAFQYRDFVRWQNEGSKQQELVSGLSFWKDQLGTSDDFYHLKCDHVRPAGRTYRGGLEKMTLPAALSESLKLWSQKERASLFMSLLAGFQILLHRYSGHDEIATGSCAANRMRVEAEDLIGRFGNDLLIRTSLAGNPTYREALARVRESSLTAYSYQHLPFGAVVDAFQSEAEPDHNPLFQVMFIFQNVPKDRWKIPGLSVSWLPVESGTAKYDLNVWVRYHEGLEIALEYNTDLFDQTTMRRILHDYRKILEAMVENPEGRIRDLPVVARPASEAGLSADSPRIDITAPHDETEERLTRIWEQLFGIQPISPQQNFFELGGDSLLAVRLFTQIEKVFHLKLPFSSLLDAPTIAELAKTLCHGGLSANCSSLVAVHPSGSRPPLICVHGGAGQILFCRSLSRFLGPDQPLYGLQPQGLGGGPTLERVEEMAEHYLSEIRYLQPHGPYFLAGNCFGGMIAFEMARRLQAQGERVALLAMFNTPAPGSLKGWPFSQILRARERIKFYVNFLRSMGTKEKLLYAASKGRGILQYVTGQAKTEFWRISSKLARNGSRAMVQKLLSVHELNLEAAKKFRPEACPVQITLFLTEEAQSFFGIDPKIGWIPYALNGLELHDVPGDIQTVTRLPHVEVLARKLKHCMDALLHEA